MTLTTKDRAPWLALPRTRDVFLAVLRSWQGERHGRILCVTVLPDHVHLLLELNETAVPAQVISGWKSGVRRAAGYAETFEPEFKGHRLRASEDPEEYALYIYLHAYRASLLPYDQTWPGYWAPQPEAFRFNSSLNAAGGPPVDWIAWPEDRFAKLEHGE